MSRVGLFGGSFDPIHEGHVAPILAAKRALALDRVIYLPTARPPHKPDREFAPAHARFAMVELALLDRPELLVSDFELSPETSYTIDTVEHFRGAHPGDEFVLLIGADSLAGLSTWRRWRDLIEGVRLAVLVRPGWHWEEIESDLPAEIRALAEAGAIDFVENEPVPISSTEIRECLRNDTESPTDPIHPRVLKYLRKYSLYR